MASDRLVVNLVSDNLEKHIRTKTISSDSMPIGLIQDPTLDKERLNSVLNSKSWRWTRHLRSVYSWQSRVFRNAQNVAVGSNYKPKILSDGKFRIYVFSRILYFGLANFTMTGLKARKLKVQIALDDDFPKAKISLDNSLYARIFSTNSDIVLHITEDVYFSKYLIFQFCLNWVKNNDNTTLFCDVIDDNQTSQFRKPNWDATYNAAIKLLPPIYMESVRFTSLRPLKIESVVNRPLSKFDFRNSSNQESPKLPQISLRTISKTQNGFSVVIPTANKKLFLQGEERWLIRDLIEDVINTSAGRLSELVVVHNEKMSLKDQRILRSYSNVRLILCAQRTLNLATKINLGVKNAKNENILISNDDIRHKSSLWLDALLSWLKDGSVGVVGPRIFYKNGLLQYAGVDVAGGIPHIIGYRKPGNCLGQGFSYVIPREVRAVTGALMATKKSIYTKVHGWDPKFKMNFNDIDYCLRVGALGYKVVYEPRSEIYHFESASRDPQIQDTSEWKLFHEKYNEIEPAWPELIYDNGIDSKLSFAWQQKYLVRP